MSDRTPGQSTPPELMLSEAEQQERYTLRMIELQDGGTPDQFEKALADERVNGQRVTPGAWMKL